jgi:hypothetical protein
MGQVDEYPTISSTTFGIRALEDSENETDNATQRGYDCEPPSEHEGPQCIEDPQPATDVASRCTVNVSFRIPLHRSILLVQRRLPDSDTERMGLVDGLLPVFQCEALRITQAAFILVLVTRRYKIFLFLAL